MGGSRRARVLLALAVVGAVAVDVMLIGRVAELRQDVERLKAEVSGLNDDVASADETLDNAQTALETLRAAVDELSDNVNDFDRRDWHEVVPAVTAATRGVEAALDEAEAALADAAPDDGDAEAAPPVAIRYPSRRAAPRHRAAPPKPARVMAPQLHAVLQ
jgi:hypothetical protein